MRLDTTRFAAGHTERATVCIIGAGPAGLSLAQALVGDGIDVIVAEAGGEWIEDASQELFTGDVVGDPYFDLAGARLRAYGGSSGHWGGICRPLSRGNFIQPPPNNVPGWPIGFEDLTPYEASAAELLEIPGNFTDTQLGPGIYKLDFQSSPPVFFADKYADYLSPAAPGIRVALNSALVDLESVDGRITAARILSEGTQSWRIEADYFALCAGGIENSRLLRWINEQNSQVLIANHDLIGRYWMEHPYSLPCHGLIENSALLEASLENRVFFGTHAYTDAVWSGVNFEMGTLRREETFSLIEDLLCVAPRLGNAMVGAFRRNLICGMILNGHSEQWPYAENRIALSNDVDALGIPKTVLHWRRYMQDRDIVADAVAEMTAAFAEADLGRLLIMYWARKDDQPLPDDVPRTGAWHHMGGTRMSGSPDHGIVNADLRVHDQDNLYIGGSSVFATGGDANPTFTIVQLSLRLADHLKTRIRA